MANPQDDLTWYRDEKIEFLYPCRFNVQSSRISTPDEPALGYCAMPGRGHRVGSQTLFIQLYPKGSQFSARTCRDILLNVQIGPMECLSQGESTLVPDAIERIQAGPSGEFFSIMMLLDRQRADIHVEVSGKGNLSDWQLLWVEVIESIRLAEDFSFDGVALFGPADAEPPPGWGELSGEGRRGRPLDPQVEQLVRSLPRRLAFLGPSIMDVATQSYDDPEDADLRAMEEAMRVQLSAVPEPDWEQYVAEVLQSFDAWTASKDRNSDALEAFMIVYGALLAIGHFGIDV